MSIAQGRRPRVSNAAAPAFIRRRRGARRCMVIRLPVGLAAFPGPPSASWFRLLRKPLPDRKWGIGVSRGPCLENGELLFNSASGCDTRTHLRLRRIKSYAEAIYSLN